MSFVLKIAEEKKRDTNREQEREAKVARKKMCGRNENNNTATDFYKKITLKERQRQQQ